MEKKRAVILGAGISGLSAAHALSKTHDVLVLEKSHRAGGWIETTDHEGFLFESGPRTFRSNASPELMKLIEELGLQKEILYSEKEAQKRFVLFEGKLEEVPSHPLAIFYSPLFKGVRFSMLTEWKRPKEQADESLDSFAERRFGRKAADRFFDPLALGIYAADSRKLSVEAAFPRLKEMERTHGSITKALFKKEKKAKKTASALFSFQSGTQMLIDALVKELGNRLCLDREVTKIEKKDDFFLVHTTHEVFEADRVICALPPRVVGTLLGDLSPNAARLLQDIEMTSLSMVQVGYEENVLPGKAFGYLVPRKENLPLFGVVFDSCIFPSQNRGTQTRLTVMMPPQENAKETALQMLGEHLGVAGIPRMIVEKKFVDAIPLPTVGHAARIDEIRMAIARDLPNFYLAGNYLEGVSVEDCIRSGSQLALT